VSDDEVIVLRKYVSEVEATMAHLVLEAHNIPSAVMRDTAGGMIPSMAILYPVHCPAKMAAEKRSTSRTSSRAGGPPSTTPRRTTRAKTIARIVAGKVPTRPLTDG
jgi:hypothetical protein